MMRTSIDILHEPLQLDFSYSIPVGSDYEVHSLSLLNAAGELLDIPPWLLPLLHDYLLDSADVAEQIAEEERG